LECEKSGNFYQTSVCVAAGPLVGFPSIVLYIESLKTVIERATNLCTVIFIYVIQPSEH